METDLVRRLADEAQYEELLANDQLVKQRNEKKCFKRFQEGHIKFKPTYKYDPGTDNWDTRCIITWHTTLKISNNETKLLQRKDCTCIKCQSYWLVL